MKRSMFSRARYMWVCHMTRRSKKPDFRENGWVFCFDRIFGWIGSTNEWVYKISWRLDHVKVHQFLFTYRYFSLSFTNKPTSSCIVTGRFHHLTSHSWRWKQTWNNWGGWLSLLPLLLSRSNLRQHQDYATLLKLQLMSIVTDGETPQTFNRFFYLFNFK